MMRRIDFYGGMAKTHSMVTILFFNVLFEVRLEVHMGPRRVGFRQARYFDVERMQCGQIVRIILAARRVSEAFHVLKENTCVV